MFTVKFHLITGDVVIMERVLSSSIGEIKEMLEKPYGALHGTKCSVKVEHVTFAEYIPEN